MLNTDPRITSWDKRKKRNSGSAYIPAFSAILAHINTHFSMAAFLFFAVKSIISKFQ